MVCIWLILPKQIEVLSCKFSMKARHNVLEWKCVCRKMNPSWVSCKSYPSLSWPKTEVRGPRGNIWSDFLHVLCKIFKIEIKVRISFVSSQILLKNSVPVLINDYFVEFLLSILHFELVKLRFVNFSNLRNECNLRMIWVLGMLRNKCGQEVLHLNT